MSLTDYKIKNSTYAVKVICAILFCVCSFIYLYCYQADVLAVTQHILSGGVTNYERNIGAVLITVFLMLVQIGVSAIMKIEKKWHALTYFPSALLLAMLSGIESDIVGSVRFSIGIVGMLLLLLVWIGLCHIIKRLPMNYSKISSVIFLSDTMWTNVLIMALLFIFASTASNSNDIFHYRMHAESCLQKNDYEGALATGIKSSATDSNLTMLRIYALARTGELGDKLFTYPVTGTSDDIVPMTFGTQCMLYPNDSIYRFLGAKPRGMIRVLPYLTFMQKRGLASPAVKDYILCAYLIDRNIDAFVRILPLFYDINGKLPVHYCEALTLYTHLRSNPLIVYSNDVMDTDYEDLQKLEKQCLTREERRHAVYDQYAGTYWWYYEYGKDIR